MDRRVGGRIRYLANQNRAYVNTLVKEEALTYGECNFMAEIYKNEGLSQDDVRQQIRIDKSAITRIMQGLLTKGYIRREINNLDHRYSCLYLTEAGREKMSYIFDAFKQSSMWMLETLTEEESDTLIMLLDKMCQDVRKKVENYE